MIKLYHGKSQSCRKAKEWLEEYNIPFQEINWPKTDMSHQEFYSILSLTETGTQEIISKRSIAYPFYEKEVKYCSTEELYDMIHMNKTLLRIPLIIDDKHLHVGFNPVTIRKFIPREMRTISLRQVQNKIREDVLGSKIS